MSWYCHAYMEIMDTSGKWYMVKKDELLRDANFYLTPWNYDGDPVEIDWLEDVEFNDLSEYLRITFLETKNQQCFRSVSEHELREKCLAVIHDCAEKEYVAFRAMGFDCRLEDGKLEFSYEFRNPKHTGTCTFPIDRSIIRDLHDALEKRDVAQRLLGALDTIEDRPGDIQFTKRIVFMRTF